MQPASAIAVTANAQVIAAGKGAIYLGAHLAAAAATSTLKLYHGTANTDPLIASLVCVANTGDDDATKGGGISCPNGIYAEITGASAAGIVAVG